MPIIVQNIEFYDNFGNGPFPSYRSNAGDRQNVKITLWSSIRINSLSDPLTLDPSTNQITCNTSNWLDEGFRVGDQIEFTIYNSGGGVITTWTAFANFVTANVIDVTTVPTWYQPQDGEFIRIEVPTKNGRGDIDFYLNHVLNSTPGTEFSLIDGESTRVKFTDVNSLNVTDIQVGTIVGNQSGQYLISAQIERNSNPPDDQRSFTISVDFTNSGIYDQEWFQSSDCLKLFTRLLWTREPGETDNVYNLTYSPSANTGWFGEARNTDVVDSTLIQGITSELDYCVPTTHTIIVDGPLNDVGIGSSYIPLDDTYYKNKVQSQKDLGMIIPSSTVALPFMISGQNPVSAQYIINIDSVTVAGSQTTIQITFTPNSQFTSFMESREEGDRLFYVWVKCGNVNHLVFSDQLTCEPPVGDPLILQKEMAYYDHSQNVNDGSPEPLTVEFNTEDDLAFYGRFLMEKGKTYTGFSAKIEGFNSATQEDFTLLITNFDFSSVPISGDGRYLLNETLGITTILPTTSVKRDAFFRLYPALDTPTEYGVEIYFPFLLRWEYWLPQVNASVDFFPNQNKNWVQYEAAPWEVRLELNLQEPLLSHLYSKEIVIKDYDSEPFLKNDISLVIDSTSQPVGVVTLGQLMRVSTTHELINGNVWDQSNVWGMITVEPFESSPRWLCSSTLDIDFNVLNPLSPLAGTTIQITYPAPNIAKLECFFDPDKINCTNGVKFTGKIKGCQIVGEIVKTTTDGIDKTLTSGETKTLA